MYKIISLVKRKPGMTREQFKAHYENSHIPLGVTLLKGNIKHHRSYLAQHTVGGPLDQEPVEGEFDAVTEIWCKDRESWIAVKKAIAARAEEVAAEGAQFLDPISYTHIYAIEEERETDLS